MHSLSGAAVRHLRGLGHALKPVVQIGKEGLTESVASAASQALATHELIKVKVQPEAPIDRHEAAAGLASATGATLAQVLGRTFLLYLRHPSKPRIALPGEKAIPAPGAASKSKKSLRKSPRAKGKGGRAGAKDERRGPPREGGPRAYSGDRRGREGASREGAVRGAAPRGAAPRDRGPREAPRGRDTGRDRGPSRGRPPARGRRSNED